MLSINNLYVKSDEGNVLLEDINLKVKNGEIIGITGHSGSGKTTLIKSILGMLSDNVKIESGEIYIDAINLTKCKNNERRKLNGTLIGYIPQSPMTCFDSRIKIGKQIIETLRVKLGMNKLEAENKSIEVLEQVNLIDTCRVMNSYPSELSGGMLQRVTLAVILAMSPQYVLADEPTSALDEENRNILINIMKENMSNMTILLISHDIKALEMLCKELMVLNDGKIIERGTVNDILNKPKEEWTKQFAEQNKFKIKGEWNWKEY